MTSEAAVRDAAKALLAAATTSPSHPSGQAYTLGELDALTSKPADYLEVNAVRRYTEVVRVNPRQGKAAWTVLVGVVTKTENNAHTLLTKARMALEYQLLAVDAVTSTPLELQPGRPVAPDDGWWSALDAWNFTL